jgi:hypothetical protein
MQVGGSSFSEDIERRYYFLERKAKQEAKLFFGRRAIHPDLPS